MATLKLAATKVDPAILSSAIFRLNLNADALEKRSRQYPADAKIMPTRASPGLPI